MQPTDVFQWEEINQSTCKLICVANGQTIVRGRSGEGAGEGGGINSGINGGIYIFNNKIFEKRI